MAYSDRGSNAAGAGGWDPREGAMSGRGGPGGHTGPGNFFGANSGAGGGSGPDGWGGRFGNAGRGFMNDMMGGMGGPGAGMHGMAGGMMNNMMPGGGMGRGGEGGEGGFGAGGMSGMAAGMMNNMMGRGADGGFGRGMGAMGAMNAMAGMAGMGGPMGMGMDRMGGGAGMDRMGTGGMDRRSGGMDRMSGGGMDRMGGGAMGGMAGMMGKAGEFFGGGNQAGMGRGGYGDRDGYGQRDSYGQREGPSPYGPGAYGGPGPGRTTDWDYGGREGRFGQGGRMDNPYGRNDRRNDRRDEDEEEEEEDRSLRGMLGRMFKRGDDDDEDEDDDRDREHDRRGGSGRYGGGPYQRGQPPYGGPMGAGGYGPYGPGDEFNRPFDGRGDDFPRTYSGGRPGGPMGRRSPYHSPYHGPMQGPGGLNEAMGGLSLGGNTGNMQMQQISLEMSAKGLKKKDLVGKSDPVCYVYIPNQRSTLNDGRQESPANMKWKVLSRTEIVKNTHTPTWGTRVPITYSFDQMQLLRFSIFDADGDYETARDGDKIGECCVSLGQIVLRGSVTVQLVRNLRSTSGSGRYGWLTVRAHSDSVEGKIRMKINFSARNLPKSDAFGKSDPFYVFTSIGTSGEENRQIHKSEVISNTSNPDWRPRRDLLSSHGKPWDRIKLRVSIYDHDTGGKSDLLGTVDFTLQQLTRYQRFDIINEKKAAEQGGRYQNSGELIVNQADVMRMPPFLAYLQGGLQLQFLVCVDFSNLGERNSLHEERNSGRLSYYGQALSAVGSILSGYTHDGSIAAFGFGAKPRYGGSGRHEPFALNENPNDPRVYGVDALINAYQRCLRNVKDGSKTKFEPLIRHAMKVTENRQVTQAQQHFTILMVLTDGQVDDMEETVDAIIECSYKHPIAIVFVGVGKGDFSDMRRLDGDKETLKSDRTSKRAKHDIVQFSQFKPNDGLEAFAASVLKEIPRRLVCYMMDAGINPNAPLQGGGMGRGMPGEMGPMGRGMPGEMGPMGRGMPGEMGPMGRGMPGEMGGMGRGMPGEMGRGMGRGMPGGDMGRGRGMMNDMMGGGRGDMMGFGPGGPGMGGRGQRSPHMNAMQGPHHMNMGNHGMQGPPHMMLPPGMTGDMGRGEMMGYGRGMGGRGQRSPHMNMHGHPGMMGPGGMGMGMPPGGGMGMRGGPEGGMGMRGSEGGMNIPGMQQRGGGEGRPGGGPSSF